jgi:outer membrane receptor protein involved in Fe transport
MSPRHLGGIGMIYTATMGLGASLVADYVGGRKLNRSNTAEAGGYTTVDASLSYGSGKYRVQLSGYNLTDRRDPVAESELSEVVTVTGPAGYYRLPGRYVEVSVSFAP